MRYLPLALLLTACGPALDTCPSTVFGAVYVEPGAPSCDYIEASALTAQRVLTDSGAWPNFAHDAPTVHVTWRGVSQWEVFGQARGGQTYAGGEVVIGADGGSLLHELMHLRAASPTDWTHQGWEGNGIYALDYLYRYEQQGDRLAYRTDEPCPTLTMPTAWLEALTAAGHADELAPAIACVHHARYPVGE